MTTKLLTLLEILEINKKYKDEIINIIYDFSTRTKLFIEKLSNKICNIQILLINDDSLMLD
ncbi:MAG: hypothetical protein IKC84_03700 [Helicobacteraceae bacterium]|nr:hypothetical protein [Helicobacteraceae bacterium]